jgi:ribonuclease HII
MSSNTLPNIMETELYENGSSVIIGVDEAGRGAIAGPVVCAAVSFPKNTPLIDGICDSKKIISEKKRFELYEKIISTKGISWYVSVIPHDKIDEINILEATMLGMRSAINVVVDKRNGCYALIDGNRLPIGCDCDAKTIVKGDGKEYVIGCASIIAKVTRDIIMNYYHNDFPNYDFSTHKGYPTQKHKEILKDNGPTIIHRRTFNPVKDCCK